MYNMISELSIIIKVSLLLGLHFINRFHQILVRDCSCTASQCNHTLKPHKSNNYKYRYFKSY